MVKAAQQLKEKDSLIKIAKVNGPEEEELLAKMEVKGYPTLFFYRDGEPIPYGGGRMANEMVEWVEKKNLHWKNPPFHLNSELYIISSSTP